MSMCEWSATEPTRLHLLLTKMMHAIENDQPLSSISLTADEFEQCGGAVHKDRTKTYDLKRQVAYGLSFLTEWIGNGKLPGKLGQEIKHSNRIMTHYHGPKWAVAPVPDDDVDGPDSEDDGEEEEAEHEGEEEADGEEADDALAKTLLEDAEDDDDDDDDDEYQPGADDAEEEEEEEEGEEDDEEEGEEEEDDAEEAAVPAKLASSKKPTPKPKPPAKAKAAPKKAPVKVAKVAKAVSVGKEPSSPVAKSTTASPKPSPLSGNKRKASADSSDILAKAKSILAASPASASKKPRSPFA